MAKRPQGVVPSDAAVAAFNGIIGNAYARIFATFERTNPSTRWRRRQIAKQIEQIAKETNTDLRAWTDFEVASFYEKGLYEATTKIGGAGDIKIVADFDNFHREAIEAIAQDTYVSIASGMEGLNRTAQQLISNAARQTILSEIATGSVLGDTQKSISRQIQKSLRKEGITALVDRGGRKWDLRRYGDMLARTKLTQAHNTGTVNRMAENKYDLAQVSDHAGECSLCRPWENEILSVRGISETYTSLDEATADGLFHPNCRHVITPWHPIYLDSSVVWDGEKYVPWKELKTKSVTVGKSTKKYNDFVLKADRTVYRAIDSTDGRATLGNGTYFAFDEQNVKRYGKNIKSLTLSKDAKMLNLPSFDSVGRFAEDARIAMPDRYKELLTTKGEQGIEQIIKEYAQKLGYDGIVGADDVFGSVIFDKKKFLTAVAKTKDVVALKSAELDLYNFNKIAKGKQEKLIVLDNAGNRVLERIGTRNEVRFSVEEAKKMKNTIVTHNHPNTPTLKTGPSLSIPDITIAANYDLAEVRVVANNATFALKRPVTGWVQKYVDVKKRQPYKPHFAVDWAVDQAKYSDEFIDLKNDFTKKYQALEKSGATSRELSSKRHEFNEAIHNKLIELMAKTMGWNYTVTKK